MQRQVRVLARVLVATRVASRAGGRVDDDLRRTGVVPVPPEGPPTVPFVQPAPVGAA